MNTSLESKLSSPAFQYIAISQCNSMDVDKYIHRLEVSGSDQLTDNK